MRIPLFVVCKPQRCCTRALIIELIAFDANLVDTPEIVVVARQDCLIMYSGRSSDKDVNSPNALATVHEPALHLSGAASSGEVKRKVVSIPFWVSLSLRQGMIFAPQTL